MYLSKNQFQVKYILVAAVVLLGIGGILGFAVSFFFGGGEDAEEEFGLPWEEGFEQSGVQEPEVEFTNYVVDIKGEVVHPGVYSVSDGDRVHDVIEKAGGFTEKASKDAVNLAEKCYDEMVIVIPTEGKDGEAVEMITTTNSGSSDDGILLNQASSTELTELPGIGPAKADAIISFREENGPFQKAEDLVQVPGIGEKTFEALKDLLIVR